MNPTNYWKLGAFVLGGVLLGLGVLIWLGAANWNRRTETVTTYFDESVQGLEVGSPIKFRGVSVGTVHEISVASDLRHVRVTSLVYENVLRRLGLAQSGGSFRPSEGPTEGRVLRIQLTSTGITGVKFLQIDFFDAKRFPVEKLPFDPGPNYLPSTPSTLKSIEEAAVDVGMQLPELTMRASQTLQRLADSVEEIKDSVKPLLADDGVVVRVLDQYERTGAQFERTAAVLEQEVHGAKIAETTTALRNASASVMGFSSDVSATADDARDSLAALQETLDSIRALTDYLERDPASIVRGRAPVTSTRGPVP
ncbi:MAG TPA: MlaD family protein [Myxococcota bacterium]|nr:MlaD family protein [Myxococcota bacterium]